MFRTLNPAQIPILTHEQLTNIPYRSGPTNAKIAFVGEAPGNEEEQHPQHLPFVGASGQLLRQMGKMVGCDVDGSYITNILKVRPKYNDFERFVRENPKTLDHHIRLLASELRMVSANVIVPVGGKALRVLCGDNHASIESWRGSIIEGRLATISGRKCIPLIHPAATLRNWKKYWPASIEDLRRIARESHTKGLNLPRRTYTIRPTFDQAIEYLDACSKTSNYISVDTETLVGKMVSVQFSYDPSHAICIPFQYRSGRSYWPTDQEAIIWKKVLDVIHNNNRQLIGQNFINYDLFYFAAMGGDPKRIHDNIALDTMYAAQCLDPELPKGLDFLTSIYTREPFYKSERKGGWLTREGENEFWTYGCKDVVVVAEIAPQQKKELLDDGLWSFYEEYYHKLSWQQVVMSLRGLRRDPKKHKELELSFTKDIIINQAKLNVLVDSQLNVKSPKRMKHFLYGVCKYKKRWKRGAGGQMKVTTDKHAVLDIATQQPSEALTLITKVREQRTLYSDDIKTTTDSDGRVRSMYGFTKTIRFTSSQSPFGTGTNLQNITKKMRIMFIPDEGFVFLEMDLSQAEARIVAYRARDYDGLVEIFESGQDIHKYVASIIFKKLADLISFMERYTAKRIVHATNYDMGPKKFAEIYNMDIARFNLDIPFINKKQAGDFQKIVHKAFPNIRDIYHREIREEVSKTKMLHGIWGSRMIFHDRLGPDLFREAYAYYAQNAIAQLTNMILMKIAKEVTVLHQMHDGLLMQVKPDEVKDIMNYIHDQAQIPLTIEGRIIIIPEEYSVGDNWGEMKEVERVAA